MEENVTYGTARFWIQDDYYTIAEVEDMLVQFRKTQRELNRALSKSMEKANEATDTTQETQGR